MTIRTSISKRDRKRTLTCGAVILQPRYVLNFNDPRTGKRRQLFFRSQREAIARRDSILAAIAADNYQSERSSLTVAGAIEHWLENRRTDVKPSTWKTYRQVSGNCITGPILVGTPAQRKAYRETGSKPEGAFFVDALGPVRIADLTTADIRRWHRTILAEVGSRTASVAKTFLCAALALAAEDFSVRPPPMPTKLGRGRGKPKRTLLTPAQVGMLLKAAREDDQRGVFYAFPFLTGMRPSEMLGLLWGDIDFDRNIICVCRVQERTGELCELTKTAAGVREIPLSLTLRNMLTQWRSICPHRIGEPHRVFPGPTGGPLLYFNWRSRLFKPALLRAGIPYVPPYTARRLFASVLQSRGVELAVVARLIGHGNPAVTLACYSVPVANGDAAIANLEASYLEGEVE